jgi:putative nucleotidyltransferase with HDIG domain
VALLASPPPSALTVEDLLGCAPPEPGEVDPIDDEMLELMLQLVRRHFIENRPDPASFPGQAMRAMELLREPEVDLRRLTSLVAQEPALGARVLRVANSAAYNRGTEVSDLRQAITRLGTREVSTIVLGIATQSLFDPTAKAEYQLFRARWDRLFHHAMTSAMAAAQLALDLHQGRSAEAFMGGLFHDIGKSIALRSVCALVLSGRTSLDPEDAAIDRLLEAVHVEIGAEMHSAWGLPHDLLRLCASHHHDEVPVGPEFADVHLVRVVSGFAAYRATPGLAVEQGAQVSQSLEVLGLTAAVLPALRRRIGQHAQRVSTMFGVSDPAPAS